MKLYALSILFCCVGIVTPGQFSFGDDSMHEGYHVYWLEAAGPSPQASDQYTPLLVLSRMPLSALAKQNEMSIEVKDADAPPLLDASAIYLETYQRRTIWNRDARPIKILRDLIRVDDDAQTAMIGSRKYTIQPADIQDVIQLLEHPEGVPPVPLHRRHAAIEGARHTTRALAMLLKAQVKRGQS